MEKTTKITIAVGILTVAIIVLGVFVFLKKEIPPVIQEPQNVGAYSPFQIANQTSQNGLYTFVKSGSFIDASTTIVSLLNPFGTGSITATSTVDLISLDITGVATSTYTIACGASTGPTVTPAYTLLSSDSIATSTYAHLENNISSSYNGGGAGGGSVAKIMLTKSYPYFVCNITSVYTGAFTDVTNTFDGTFKARIYRNR